VGGGTDRPVGRGYDGGGASKVSIGGVVPRNKADLVRVTRFRETVSERYGGRGGTCKGKYL